MLINVLCLIVGIGLGALGMLAHIAIIMTRNR